MKTLPQVLFWLGLISIPGGEARVIKRAGCAQQNWAAFVRYGLRVQLVTATLLVVYRQGFRSPRSCAGVD